MNEARFRAEERALWESLGAEPSERELRLNRCQVTIRAQELGSGPPVLFLHGASSCGATWADLVVRLPNFRCIVVDRPGAGLSKPRQTPFTDIDDLQAFADDFMLDVLESLRMDSLNVVATSQGGYYGLRGAAAHPEFVERMMLFGWVMGAPSPPMPLFMRMGALPGLGRMAAAMPVNERIVRSMFRRIGLREALEAGKISDDVIALFTSLMRDTDTYRNEMSVNQVLLSFRRGMDPRIELDEETLRKIKAPCRVVVGDGDPFTTPELARKFASRLPDGGLEIMRGAGHAVWMDDSDHVAEVTAMFLTSPA
ncbi:MAG: alpha/beta hydrolase [Actinobacteria bacterium]|nr:alpha/beta hydrolase [Actinomycetota bacterium]